MSLPRFDTQGSLFGSLTSVAADLFSETDRYKLFAQKIWPVLAAARPELEACYTGNNGRAALEPVLLLGVVIFQFLERVPDRQAADLVKYHLGWKLALNLELGAQGFHPTSLVTFRQRLLEHERGQIAFDAVLAALQQEGLVPKRGTQRLDSTHVLGLVARLSKLESVREAVRLALEEIVVGVAESQHPDFWPQLWERYVENKLDYKSAETILQAKQHQAGVDTWALLCWLEALPVEIREGRQVALLRRVFGEYYTISESKEITAIKVHASGVVQNPHDPEAQWSAKGHGEARKEWVGYKVQVAEGVGPAFAKGEPPRNFLTSLVTQSAIESDDGGMPAIFAAQAARGLEKPAQLYVDGAYVSAAALAEAARQERELVGPARPSVANHTGFRTEDFTVDVEARRATCPAAQLSTQCSRLEERQTGKVVYRFEWSTHCHDCLLRTQCLGEKQKHRSLLVGEHHTVLQARRREQQTPVFRERMHVRNGIESTQSELVRAHGLRKARYRGKAKVDLQNQFIGAACNIKRWLNVLVWEVRTTLRAISATDGALATA